MRKITIPMAALLSILILLTMGCGLFSTNDDESLNNDPEPQDGDIKVLIIGNKFLRDNHADVMIKNLAGSSGESYFIETEFNNDWDLGAFAADNTTSDKISKREWDVVILQGNLHYIAQIEWQAFLLPALTNLKNKILASNPQCKIIYMMPWAYKDGYNAIAGQIGDYNALQQDIIRETKDKIGALNIAIAPVGAAWNDMMINHPNIQLYLYIDGETNGDRPGLEGSFLAACVIYVTASQKDIQSISYNGNISTNTAQIIRSIASDIVLENLADWGLSTSN